MVNRPLHQGRVKHYKRKKRCDDCIKNYPPSVQIQMLSKLLRADQDLKDEILDPYRNEVFLPQQIGIDREPEKPSHGIFSVIFRKKIPEPPGYTFRTELIEAKDGFDARSKFEADNIGAVQSKEVAVCGIQCAYVPRSIINKYNKEIKGNENTVIGTSIKEEFRTEVSSLEQFLYADELSGADLTEFL